MDPRSQVVVEPQSLRAISFEFDEHISALREKRDKQRTFGKGHLKSSWTWRGSPGEALNGHKHRQ